MNTAKHIGTWAALWAVTAAGPALAAAEYVDPAEGFVSSKSRDDVRRELIAAQADGTAASCKVDGTDNARLCGPVAARSSRLARGTGSDAVATQRLDRTGSAAGASQAPSSGR